jgi:two-component system sensor histidine kinase HydH
VRQLELEHMAQLGEMSAVLAHEIRNPLGTIKGFAQLLAEQRGGTSTELVEPILSETGRLENLVRDLLLYGRPPAPAPRHPPLQRQPPPVQRP